MPQQHERRRFLASVLILLAAGLGALATARPAHAADIVLCNKGDVPFKVVAATRQGDGLFTARGWFVEGWFEVARKACSSLPDHTDQPIYLAVGFVDALDDWGAADFKSRDDDDSDSWQHVETALCVADGAFNYRHDGDYVDGPCDSGYFRFPTSLYLEPDGDTSRYTLNLSIDDASISKLPEKHGVTRSDSSAAGKEYAGGRSFGDDLADAFWQSLKQAVVDAAERASDERRASPPDRNTLESQGAPVDSPAPPSGPPPGAIIVPPGTVPAAEEPELEPPQIFRPGTLTAILAGEAVVRRVRGSGHWFGADGKPADSHYYLDGKTTSDFFDPPTQHPPADELAEATAKLAAAIASFPANKTPEVTSEGRFSYAFEATSAGVRHYTADLVTLDVDYASNVEGTDGYTGIVITCRTFDPCVIGWSEDAEGHVSDGTTTGGFRIFVATDQDRDALRAALAELKRLYPAEPKVTTAD